MEKQVVPWNSLLKETFDSMTDSGLLLVAQAPGGQPNPMTIGWALIGSVWSQPVFTVLVRPSRYTHDLLEANGDFTVNVLPSSLAHAADHCGAASGRDGDKFKATGLTAAPSLHVNCPGVEEALVVYECRTVLKNQVLPETLDPAIRNSAYGSGNFHTLYYGKILCVRADRSAAKGA